MNRIKLKCGGKRRRKAFFGADGAIMAAATLAAAGITAGATAAAAKSQAKSVVESAKTQAQSIKDQTANSNNLQKEQLAFTRSQNQENRQQQQDIQTTLQLMAGQENMNDRMERNKMQVKLGGKPKRRSITSPFYGGGQFQVTDGGGVIPISVTPEGYGLYELYGNDHEHYHKTSGGKRKTGVGIKFNDGSVVEGEGNQNTNQGELLYVTPNDAVFISKHSIDGFNPTKAVMNGVHPMQAFAIQEELKAEKGLNDDGSNKKQYGGPFNKKYFTSITKNEDIKLPEVLVTPNVKDNLTYLKLLPYVGEKDARDYIKEQVALRKELYTEQKGGGKFGGGSFRGSGVGGRFTPINDYTSVGSFNKAFDKAYENNEPEFKYGEKYYNTDKELNPVRELNNRFVGASKSRLKLKETDDYDYEIGPYRLRGLNAIPIIESSKYKRKYKNNINDDGSKSKRRSLKRMLGGPTQYLEQANMTQNPNNGTSSVAGGVIYGINNSTISPVEELQYNNSIAKRGGRIHLKCGGRKKAAWGDYAGATYNAAGNVLGAGISVLGNMWAANRLGKSYQEAGGILADAYSQMRGIDLNELKMEDYAAPHTLAVIRDSNNVSYDPQRERIRRNTASERREINRGTLSSAARQQRLAASNDRMLQRISEVDAAENNAREAIRQGNAERITQTAQANADRDVQARRDFSNQRLSLLQYNNNIENSKIAGMAQARADALTQSSMAHAQGMQASMSAIGSSLANSGQGFASAFDAARKERTDFTNTYVGLGNEDKITAAILRYEQTGDKSFINSLLSSNAVSDADKIKLNEALTKKRK